MELDVDGFIRQVSDLRLPGLFNPYVETCPEHDRPDAPKLRTENLAKYLRALLCLRPTVAWIGRDLGYRGGRRTGLPLTDEIHLSHFENAYRTGPLCKATQTPPTTERTATEVWRLLPALPTAPLLWNVVPLHPYQESSRLSNRPHPISVAYMCESLLALLLAAFRPTIVCALGRDAERALTRLGVRHVYVRHPSHGGQQQFRRSVISFFQIRGGGHGSQDCLAFDRRPALVD